MMALDLFCYCSNDLAESEKDFVVLMERFSVKFKGEIIIAKIRTAGEMHKEIASEFNFSAKSFFLVSINNKEKLATKLNDVAREIKSFFEEGAVIVLLNNENFCGEKEMRLQTGNLPPNPVFVP